MFTKQDLAMYKALKSVLESGKFEVQGKAAMQVAVIFKWFNDLEAKIASSPQQKSLPPPSDDKPKLYKKAK